MMSSNGGSRGQDAGESHMVGASAEKAHLDRATVSCENQAPTARDLLLAARVRIAASSAWVQGQPDADFFSFAVALDEEGRPCSARDRRAVRWNACGAIIAGISHDTSDDELCSAFRRLALAVGIVRVCPEGALLYLLSDWHDARGRTHAEVLAALDLAAGGTAS